MGVILVYWDMGCYIGILEYGVLYWYIGIWVVILGY